MPGRFPAGQAPQVAQHDDAPVVVGQAAHKKAREWLDKHVKKKSRHQL